MKNFLDYWLAQSLSLIFYMITLAIYNRARKQYGGGKIAAAINLIMVSLGILFLSDFADYFSILILPIGRDTKLIIKILLKLVAICVLFFGGLRFFISKPGVSGSPYEPAALKDVEVESVQDIDDVTERRGDSTVALHEDSRTKPTLGRYEILEQIGRGAMGVVYKGRDPKLNRMTAIKTIRFTDDFDEDEVEKVREQFHREAEVLAQLSHPNIVSIYDVGEDLDLSYLALEYLEGESLERYTDASNLLPFHRCIDIIRQVCDALEYLHNHNIVHRDIKPANIMILKDGMVKLADFGVARAAAGSKTRTGVVKGTPYYMSPEQIKGMKVTGPSDIFSLGIVFYQLITGNLPFVGDNLSAIMYQITAVEPEPPTAHNPKIDQKVLAVLNRALAKNLQDRYQTAKEMGDQIRVLIKHLESGKAPESGEVESLEAVGSSLESGVDSGTFLSRIELDSLEQEEQLDFSDLDQILEPDETLEEEVEDAFDALISEKDTEDFYEPAITGIDPIEKDDIDFSDLRLKSEADDKAGRIALDISRYSPHYIHTPTAEDRIPTEVNASKPALGVEDSAVKGERYEDSTSIKMLRLSRFKLPLVASAGVFLALAGFYYFFWKSGPGSDVTEQKTEKKPIQFQPLEKDKKQKEHEVLEKIRQERQKEIALLEKIRQEKQKEEERLAKLADEKQKEKERLAKIAEENRKEKERLAQIESAKQKERDRLAQIEKEKQEQQERLAKIEKEKTDAVRGEELKEIDRLTVRASEFLDKKNYREAKTSYESALKLIEQSDYKDEQPFSKHKSAIEKALAKEDIVYGSKGFINFRDKWLPPDEYEKMLYGEGYVKYKGKFVHYRKLENEIEKMGYQVVQSFLASKYSGQLIHKKQISLHEVVLKQNDDQSSRFVAYFKWEVWTFKEIGTGECPLELIYHVEENKWKIAAGCE